MEDDAFAPKRNGLFQHAGYAKMNTYAEIGSPPRQNPPPGR
jgi:hypothetical protein